MHRSFLPFTLIITAFLLLLSAGCITDEAHGLPEQETGSASGTTPFAWLSEPMTDITGGDEIRISDLMTEGKPIIIHTFAVWCPACTIQLRETSRLVRENPDSYIMIGMDIDPNEDALTVKNHIQRNGFSGYFVNAPARVSRDIVQTLGTGTALTLPQTIIICHGEVILLGDGVYGEKELSERVSAICPE